MAEATVPALAQRIRAGEERAIARGLTLVESAGTEGRKLLALLRAGAPVAARRPDAAASSGTAPPDRATVIGVTGAPGSGKSTLVDRLIQGLRAAGERVAVLAVDPSSPYTGGAILGDRIRMMRWFDDPGVFIRSMASRGQLGGLSAATLQAAALLEAAGFDRVLIETVGVGQSEVDIAGAADTTLLVLTPGQGDGVQAFKAGIMEIADIFVVNKADHPGTDLLRREIAALLSLGSYGPGDWKPPVMSVVATGGEGVDRLLERVRGHEAHLRAAGLLAARRRGRLRAEVQALLASRLGATLAGLPEEFVDDVLRGEHAPDDALLHVFGVRR